MIFKWKPEVPFRKHDAQVIGEHLEKLRIRNNGLTPELLVKDGERKTSPLHPILEWDQAIAAENYRLSQASYILRAIVTTVEENTDYPERTTRAFVVVSGEEDRSRYMSIRVALSDPLYRAEILARARRELASWQARYAELEELADLFDAIKPYVSTATKPELAEDPA